MAGCWNCSKGKPAGGSDPIAGGFWHPLLMGGFPNSGFRIA